MALVTLLQHSKSWLPPATAPIRTMPGFSRLRVQQTSFRMPDFTGAASFGPFNGLISSYSLASVATPIIHGWDLL